MAAMLTEDLISEILVRLPVKSLLSCRCVCKAWFNLIKSPNFIDMHLNHSKSKTDCILISHHLKGNYKSISFHDYESLDLITSVDLDPLIKICEPCNGLLCLIDEKNEVVLYNPSLGKRKSLPCCPFSCPKGWKTYVEGFGLGFVSNPNHYKVILLVTFYQADDSINDEDEPADKVEIYDLSSNSWREIERDYPHFVGGNEYGTLFNGALHWITSFHNILYFNLSTEVFPDMPLPGDLYGKDDMYKSLVVFNDCLALFVTNYYNHNSEEQFVDIWVMKEYGVSESWTKQVRIGPPSAINFPLMLWKNEAILFESIDGQLLSCALDIHEVEESEIKGVRGPMSVMAFQESLISLE